MWKLSLNFLGEDLSFFFSNSTEKRVRNGPLLDMRLALYNNDNIYLKSNIQKSSVDYIMTMTMTMTIKYFYLDTSKYITTSKTIFILMCNITNNLA